MPSYKRQLPPSTPGEDEPGEYIRPKEIVDANEDAVIAQLRDTFVGDARGEPRHAGKNNPAFHERHWGHTTGLIQGTLEIDRIEALPAQFRVGLYAQNELYPVVCRPNFVIDKGAKLSASRMAVKLQYPMPVPNMYAASGSARELDLLFAEGSAEPNGIGHAFFFRNALEFAMVMTLKPPSLKTLSTLVSPSNWGVIGDVLKRFKPGMAYLAKPPSTTTGWSGKWYFGAGPFALGDGAIKMCLRPRQPHPIGAVNAGPADAALAHRTAMEAWIAAGTNAVFDLCIQLATSACIRAPGKGDPSKAVMTAEYCDLDWDEAKSPYIPVGTLTLPATAQADLTKTFPWSPLQFNAWNTLDNMRPLGQLFRARKHVHKSHSDTRVEHLYDATPGAMVDKAPFQPPSPSD